MINNNLPFIFTRELIIKAVRSFFDKQDFHEIITPILNKSIPREHNIFPFTTTWKMMGGKKKFFLPTSPEKNLKKMLALGLEKCYSIGHTFRNLEAAGTLHTPEFLMLEWYRKNADYTNIMSDIKNLLVSIYRYIDTYRRTQFYKDVVSSKWLVFSLPELFKKYAKLDVVEFVADSKKRPDYDKIFVNEIESRLPKTPCFIIDYPSVISPLCKPKKENPLLAERFEFYWKGIEFANGNTENTDIGLVKKGLRKPIDYDFLESLKRMQDFSYAGTGFGIDRLAMVMSNSTCLL